MAMREAYPTMYLKTFEEGQDSLGVVVPDPEPNDPRPYQLVKQAMGGKAVVYSTEPPMHLIYGGRKAIKIAGDYFRLVTTTAAALKQISQGPDNWHKDALSQVAYLFPVFCVQMGIDTDKAAAFADFLFASWSPKVINPDGYLMPEDWLAEKEKLARELQKEINATDPDLMELTAAILSDPTIRFDVALFDDWANGLSRLSGELHTLSAAHQLCTYSHHPADPEGLWPILKSYLEHVYTLLDIPAKDRLYLALILKQSVLQQKQPDMNNLE